MAFVFEKLDLGSTRARSSSIVSLHSRITNNPIRKSSTTLPVPIIQPGSARRGFVAGDSTNEDVEIVHPEDALELLCGDVVVDPRITLATLKQYYGSGGDMLLHYRPRKGVVVQ
jgi:WD repeat-containing protein 48